jgi:hypothetical protein
MGQFKPQFMGGHACDECPAHEGDYDSSGRACANEYEVLRVDRCVGADVYDVRRAGEGVRVPEPRGNEGAHDARSDASILQKSSAQAQPRRGAKVFREAEPERERHR